MGSLRSALTESPPFAEPRAVHKGDEGGLAMLLKTCQLYDGGQLHLSDFKPTLTSYLTLCGRKFRSSNSAPNKRFDSGRGCCTYCTMKFNRLADGQLSQGSQTLRDKILGRA